jgi:hypothetical protein
MTRLTIKQTVTLIEYFQDRLQGYLEVRKHLDTTQTREDIENIINTNDFDLIAKNINELAKKYPNHYEVREI